MANSRLKTTAAELPQLLSKELVPLYLILGEDLTTAMDAADAVRQTARARGVDERVSFPVEAGFNWSQFSVECASQSLFGARRLLDVVLLNGKVDSTGAKVLSTCAASVSKDLLIMVTALGAERKLERAAWVKNFASTGVIVNCPPIHRSRLPHWIDQRLLSLGVPAPSGTALLLAEYTEGNVLAASQAVDRLLLLSLSGPIDLEAIRKAAVDEARYGLFECVDVALAGDPRRALHMLIRLRDVGTEPTLVLWAVTRELRLLAAWRWAEERKLAAPPVWASRRKLIGAAARRRSSAGWLALLAQAATVDRYIKGRESGYPWASLEELVLRVSGVEWGSA